MANLRFKQIEALQKGYRVTPMQKQINSGLCWHLEGSQGRFAADLLEAGICMLPKHVCKDYYGNTIPSRDNLKPGTKGTFKNSQNFWQKVYDGDYEAINYLVSVFGADTEEEIM